MAIDLASHFHARFGARFVIPIPDRDRNGALENPISPFEVGIEFNPINGLRL